MNAVGFDAGDVLVGFGRDYADESHVTVIDDDVNRRHGLHGVAVEAGVAVNGVVNGAPDAIVIGRRRKDLDLVVDALHAFDLFDDVFGVRFQRRSGDLAGESDGTALDLLGEIIENAIVGQHNEFMPDFFGDALCAAGRFLSKCDRSQQHNDCSFRE